MTQNVQGRRRFDFLSVIPTGVHHSVELHRHADAAGTIGGCGEIHGRILSALYEEEMHREWQELSKALTHKESIKTACAFTASNETISHKVATMRSGIFPSYNIYRAERQPSGG